MEYSFPIYDINGQSIKGDDCSEFRDYVEYLLETEKIEGATKDVFEKIINTCTAQLTETQMEIVEQVIRKDKKECEVCGQNLRWYDLILSDINGSLCSYHANQSE